MKAPKRINTNSFKGVSVTAEQMSKVDKIATGEFGIPLSTMMDLAGYQLAELASKNLKKKGKVLILVGSGHNGGGGLVAAKYLYKFGFQVSVFLTSSNLKPTTANQLEDLKKLKVKILEKLPNLPNYDLLIDAILGYNIKGDVKEPIRSVIGAINTSRVMTISLDLPSGLNPSTGEPNGISVKSTATLTLAAPKLGLLKQNAGQYVGKLYLANIGIPKEVFKNI